MSNRFSRTWFESLQCTWEKNLNDIPDFDHAKLKVYLCESTSKTFDKESLRAYKSLKAYKFFEEGYVQKLLKTRLQSDGSETEYYIVKADVMASMAQRIYKTYVCFRMNDGGISGGACSCVAGYVFKNIYILFLLNFLKFGKVQTTGKFLKKSRLYQAKALYFPLFIYLL